MVCVCLARTVKKVKRHGGGGATTFVESFSQQESFLSLVSLPPVFVCVCEREREQKLKEEKENTHS